MEYRVYIREGKKITPRAPSRSATAAFVLYYHITFRTKWSKALFQGDAAAASLADILIAICADKNYDVFAVAVLPDHVRIVISIRPDVAPAETVKCLKGISAREFNKRNGTAGSIWSDGYSVEAVGTKNVYQVLRYVAS